MDASLNLEGGIHFVFAWILLLLYRGAFKDWQIEEFLRCKDEFLADHIPGNCMRHITARDFYEACAVCYKAVRMEQRVHFPFKDSKEEHLRYEKT